MKRSTALVVTLLSGALALPTLAGCSVSVGSGSKEGKSPPPPPPPPPPPAPKAEPAPEPEPAPAPVPQTKSNAVVKGASVSIPGNIVFDHGQATLKADSESEETLGRLKAYMEESKERVAKLRIEGHTDNVGSPEDNMKLSGDRALTIKRWLIDHGVPAERLIAVGFGLTKPIAPNTTEEGKAKNRRTEFKIAEIYDKQKKARPYMGLPVDGGGKVFD
jgi:OmpA-OmpF porin, OOP family